MATTSPPAGMGLASFTQWWSAEYPKVQQDWNTSTQKIGDTRASLTQWQNDWKPVSWEGSGWQTRYNTQQQGMDDLLSRIQSFGTSSDMADANSMVAQSYGMTPEQYALIQEENTKRMSDQTYAAQSDASAANSYLETISNSAFAQEQDKADRVALRQMEDQMGQQLESIFGDRGGIGGFQAAYELTSQLQSTYLTQKTQEHLGMFNQAVAAVNANNQYFQNLIQQGALSSKEYLSMRFDQLQTGYQDYLAAMNQTMQEWQTIESVDRAQFDQVSQNLQSQIDNMTEQMTLEMGGEATLSDYIESLYNVYTQPIMDLQAIEDEQNEAERSTGSAILTAGVGVAGAATAAATAAFAAGGAAATIPVVGWVIGGLLAIIGIGFLIAGNSGGGTSTPTSTEPRVNPGADRH